MKQKLLLFDHACMLDGRQPANKDGKWHRCKNDQNKITKKRKTLTICLQYGPMYYIYVVSKEKYFLKYLIDEFITLYTVYVTVT